LTSISTYFLALETLNCENAAIISSILLSILPGSIAKTTAGHFDSEGLSVLLITLVFYFWIRSVKSGSIIWSLLSAALYTYLSVTWSKCTLIGNLISVYVLLLVLADRYTLRYHLLHFNDTAVSCNQYNSKPNHLTGLLHTAISVYFSQLLYNIAFSTPKARIKDLRNHSVKFHWYCVCQHICSFALIYHNWKYSSNVNRVDCITYAELC